MSIALDRPELAWMGAFLNVLVEERVAPLRLWRFTHHELSQDMLEAGRASGTHVLGLHLYKLRHGGASHDALTSFRPLMAIKKRGGWTTDASVRRYERSGRLQQELMKLPSATRNYGKAVEKQLEFLFRHPSKATPPPFL